MGRNYKDIAKNFFGEVKSRMYIYCSLFGLLFKDMGINEFLESSVHKKDIKINLSNIKY